MSDLVSGSEWDLVVVGGGAAGFFAAISAAQHASTPLRIAILEKSGQLLQKVKISGGGRCNVTHDCLEPRDLTAHYPRGQRSLIGPFHHFGPAETIAWFNAHGVDLKVEKDGRMFPTTDSSQTIIDCLMETAQDLGIQIFTRTGVTALEAQHSGYALTITEDLMLRSQRVLLATGGTRVTAGAKLAASLGHTLHDAVPSLFTFTIDHPLLTDLEGLSVHPAHVHIMGTKLENQGPLLVTHWGVSGPGVLKLSALGARVLAEQDYCFDLKVNWCPGLDVARQLQHKRQEWGTRQLATRSPLAAIPKRLWVRFCELAHVAPQTTWSQLPKEQEQSLVAQLTETLLPVTGKSLNKDEFVTCGGVELREINLKTMESKLNPGLYFAGEIMNIDGVTGGFNFQNAWTSGHLAGSHIAACNA